MVLAAALVLAAAASFGCAPPLQEMRFTEILQQYPSSHDPLRIPRLTSAPTYTVGGGPGSQVLTIIVHPGYSLFFRSRERNIQSEVKYDLLKLQLDNEAAAIRRIARSGKPLILVVPGNYRRDSVSPQSYIFFLNSLAEGSSSVFYILSEDSNSGSLSIDNVASLYWYMQARRVDRVLIGGGYIGRCESEFYAQLTTYVDNVHPLLVPELSSVSPDDINDTEAEDMLDSLRRKDFTPIRLFIEDRNQQVLNIYVPDPASRGRERPAKPPLR